MNLALNAITLGTDNHIYRAVMGLASLRNTFITSAAQTDAARSLAVDDNYVYYPDKGANRIIKMDKNDLSAVLSSAVQTGYSLSIVIDNDYLYYADYNGKKVIKMKKSDLSVVASSAIQTGGSWSIVVDDTYLYYADDAANKVVKMNKSNLAIVTSSAAQTGMAYSIAIDDTHLYYANNTDYTVAKMRKSDFVTVAAYTPAGQSSLSYSIAVDDNFIYYAAFAESGTLRRINKTNMVLADAMVSQKNIRAVVTDVNNSVYWSAEGSNTRYINAVNFYGLLMASGSIVAASLTSSDPIYAIALDANHVYCTDATNKKVIKLKRYYELLGYERAGD